ncbi:MAG: hypothetical protein ABFS22_11275 [Pseudomonadota bacterium]
MNIADMYTEANDAPRELIHDHEHPVTLQKNGFTPKQVNAPKAVPGVSEEGQLLRRVSAILTGSRVAAH